MTYILAICLSITALLKRKNKFFFWMLVVFIFIMVGFSRGLADTSIYLRRFYSYKEMASYTEIGFTFLMRLANQAGLSFDQWTAVFGLFYALIAGFVVYKCCEGYDSFPLVMLLIYPICMDATQKRQTIAMCIGWIALYFLQICNKDKKKRKNFITIYIILSIIAVSIHTSTILYLLLIPAAFLSTNICIYIAIACMAVLYINNAFLLNFLVKIIPNLSEKIQIILADSSTVYSRTSIHYVTIRILVVFASYALPYLYTKLKKKQMSYFQIFVLKCNILMLSILPLIYFNVNFYRAQTVLILFDYCAIATMMKPISKNDRPSHHIIISSSNFRLGLITAAMSLADLYLLVLRYGNINTVFIPFMNMNAIIH